MNPFQPLGSSQFAEREPHARDWTQNCKGLDPKKEPLGLFRGLFRGLLRQNRDCVRYRKGDIYGNDEGSLVGVPPSTHHSEGTLSYKGFRAYEGGARPKRINPTIYDSSRGFGLRV